MFYHLTNFVDAVALAHIQTQVGKFTQQPKPQQTDKTIYGTEFDLTVHQAFPTLRDSVTQLVGELYGRKLVCINYWVSVSEPCTTVASHNHADPGSDSIISAVLYICANSTSGQLILSDYDKTLSVSAGDLVTFPATCYHSVTENASTNNRVCIAFDFKELTY